MSVTTVDAVQTIQKSRLKSIVGGSAGNLVEWFDWYVYSAFTLYFAPKFFPDENPTAQLLSAAVIFAIGFLMRPIGAWVLGTYADRKGRKSGLSLSVSLMCLGSLIIALTPTYETIGIWAPVLLVVARLMQGLSVGGEYGASSTYLSEMAGRNHRGFFSSFQYVTLISGQLLALLLLILLQSTLTDEQLHDWGWRIPFFIGSALAVVVYFIRRGLLETQSFEEKDSHARADQEKSSLFTLFMRYPRKALTVMALTAGGTLAFYTYTTYLQKFLVNTSGFSKEAATQITAGALFVFMLVQPLAGLLSDRVGRKPLMIGFGILGVAFTYVIFDALANTQSVWVAFGLCLAGLLIVTGYTSINAVVKAEMFPAHIRALGVAFPYALANTLFGGTAEAVALGFKQAGAENWYFWYVTGMIGLSLLVYIFMKDSKRHSEILED
ncbi:MAG TPA: MFS transporter [Pedomonas sp.]|uniref:MFS transporter n=1 Tax=Pedomonas sp. TaxID=2976421 RepID=UPI002F40C584